MTNLFYADMVELADTPDLGSGAVRRTGSSPAIRTRSRASTRKSRSGLSSFLRLSPRVQAGI